MKYTEISVFTAEAGIDAVCARFSMLGMEQLEIVQGRDEIADFLPKSAKYWDFADMDELCASEPCVKAYIPEDEPADDTVKALKASLAELKAMPLGFDVGSLNMIVQSVDDSVWLNAWKEAYKPFPVGGVVHRSSTASLASFKNCCVFSFPFILYAQHGSAASKPQRLG